jgi:[ribosomal protein S18]-alanine N-acetyltransferase
VKRSSSRAASKAFHVREYRVDDFDALCAIDRLCYEPALAYSRRVMRAYLDAPGADCVVAESQPGIAGFCITSHHASQGYIVTIDVLDEFRRQGVGTILLREAEKHLVEHGVGTTALDTATDNLSAIAFWEKHGYRKIGVRKGYYPNGRDAFAMIKAMTKAVPNMTKTAAP